MFSMTNLAWLGRVCVCVGGGSEEGGGTGAVLNLGTLSPNNRNFLKNGAL